MHNENGELVAAEMIIYDDEDGADQYITHMTPEAYNALTAWLDYRAWEGEEIKDESWLMLDMWGTTNIL